MNTKLYVGNLPYETTETDLADAVRGHGEVSTINIVRDRSDRPGARVRVCRDERRRKRTARHLAARQARVRGRNLTVNEAKPMPARSNGGGGGFGGGRQKREPRW